MRTADVGELVVPFIVAVEGRALYCDSKGI
jgi:hypothetical protein